MDHEDSVILRAICDRANARMISAGTTQQAMAESGEMDAIANEVMLQSSDIMPDYAKFIEKRVMSAARDRRLHSQKIRRHIAKRHWRQFQIFEDLLAFAEVSNRIQLDAISTWGHEGFDRKFASPLPNVRVIGGAGAKCHLLNSLEARAIVISQEILELLKIGFLEAAQSRARTLHEVMVVAFALAAASKNSTGYALSDRYIVSALIEQRKLAATDDRDGLAQKSRQQWGRDLFVKYGWARPVLSLRPKERPTFAHLEDYATSNSHRFLYLEFNNAVHAGALNTVSRTDFRLRYPNFTRADNDVTRTTRVLHATLSFLGILNHAITREVATEIEAWDNVVLISLFEKIGEPLRSSLEQSQS